MGLEISRNVRKRRVKADDSQMAWLKKKKQLPFTNKGDASLSWG